MVKRTPSLSVTAAALHQVAAQDTSALHFKDVQAVLPAVKSSTKSKAKSKAKAKLETLRDDEPLASEEDVTATAQGEPSFTDTGHDVVLAQTSSGSAPSSVGEELLRQAGPVPSKVTSAETGFFSTSWGLPVAIGGALALAAASGGGGGGGGGSGGSGEDSDGTPVTPPATYNLTVVPMAGKFDGGVEVLVYINGALFDTLNASSDPSDTLVWSSGKFTWTVSRDNLKKGDVLHLVLRDNNNDKSNYRDETTNISADLGIELHAWTVVPDGITEGGALNLAITPLTELAHRNLGWTKGSAWPTASDVKSANKSVAEAFGLQGASSGSVLSVDLVQTLPVATNEGTAFANASPDAKAYGQALALISSLAVKLNASLTGAPTPKELTDALTKLQDAVQNVDSSNFTLSSEALKALSEAAIAYNKAATTSNKLFTIPGVTLKDALGLDQAVSLFHYDQDGLQFQVFAPTGKTVGSSITLKFQAYTADGSLETDLAKQFTYEYTLTKDPAAKDYKGETVILPRLVANPSNLSELLAPQGANGKTLQEIGIKNSSDGLYHYKVSIDGVSSLGAFQDFNLNLNPVSIENSQKQTPTGYVKSDDVVYIYVVLDQPVQWSAIAFGQAPTLDIQYIGQNGQPHTKEATIVTDAETSGRILTFQATFTSADQANGLISVGQRALKGVLADPDGRPVDVGTVTTTLADSHLFADTTLPPPVKLILASGGHSENISDTESARFVNTLTPELTIQFSDDTGAALAGSWTDTEKHDVTVSLFAYIDDPESQNRVEGRVLVANHVIKKTDASETFKFTQADYTAEWKAKVLDGDGQAYKFFAIITDAAGNESLMADSFDLPLWLDTQAPAVESFTFDELISADENDQDFGDNITNDTTPSFVVKGEKGSLVQLYQLTTVNGVETKTLVTTNVTRIPGFGTGTDEVTVTPAASLSPGDYRFATTLTDKAGNESKLSSPVDVTLKTAVISSNVTLSIVDAPAPNGDVAYYTKGQVIKVEAKFAEAVYLPDTAETKPTISFKNKVGGSDLIAKYLSGSGRETLTFSYTVPDDNLGSVDSGTGGAIQFDADNVNIYGARNLVDVAGNAFTVNREKTVTAPATPLNIDTQNPKIPQLASTADGVASKEEITVATGLVKVTAEAGSKVVVTFSVGGKSVTKTISSASGGAEAVGALNGDDLITLGIQSSAGATLQVSARATDKAGNTSDLGNLPINIKTLAPTVSSAYSSSSSDVIGYESLFDIASVDFFITFTGLLAQAPTVANFAALSSADGAKVVGTINSVTHSGANTYIVNVTPNAKQEGTLVLQLLADATANPLKDDAGNAVSNALLNTGGDLRAEQAFDTLPPKVAEVIDNVTADVTNGTIVFTVTFSEAVQETYPGRGLENSFSVTNAGGLVVARVPGHLNQYTVTVTPNPSVASGDVELSLIPDNAGGFSDQHGNALRFEDAVGLSVAKLPLGKQAIDTVAPEAPIVKAVTASGAVVSLDEAMTGAVNISAEAGSHVAVTFTVSGTGGKSLTKPTFTASSGPDIVKLTQEDLNALGIASTPGVTLLVRAFTTDVAGNPSETSADTHLTIDTVAPSVSTVTDPIAGTAGPNDISFTVTFSEALVGTVTKDHFTATLGTVKSAVQVGTTNQYTVVVTPLLGVASGNVALTLKGTYGTTQLTDVAGNLVAAITDLSVKNSQAINTVAPKVSTVTENITSDYANSNSTVVYTVTFDKALHSSLITNSTALKAGFTAANGEVQSVTRASDTVYEVMVTPTLGRADAVMALSIVADQLRDALGNKVAPLSLLELASQKIDTSAPTAPSVLLTADTNTGDNTDTITSVTTPKFELTGLETDATVTLYVDKDISGLGWGVYNAGTDTLLYQGKATSASMTVTAISTLAEGSYSVRASQTDVHGNLGESGALVTPLVIQTSQPLALTNLVFDELEDRTMVNGTVLGPNARDYRTTSPTPTFHFQGGTEGGTAVLFLDKDKDGLLDEGEELGRTAIDASSDHTVKVNPLTALSAGTYGGASTLGDISILEINAAEVRGVSSKLQLTVDGKTYAGLTINPGPAKNITIASDATSSLTSDGKLSFTVTDGQEGGTITVVATANGGTEVVLGTVASPNGNGTVDIDVSHLATTSNVKYTGFKAYQTYAGVKSATTADVLFTDEKVSAEGITLDHLAPTVSITPPTKTSLLKEETLDLSIAFSEAVTGFTASDIEITGGGSVNEPTSTDGGETWTTTYTPAANSTVPVSLQVKLGAANDSAGNSSAASSAVALTINTTTQDAPANVVPSSITDILFVGTAKAIMGVSVSDTNNDLTEVTLSVTQGTLSITPTAGITLSGSGTTASPLTLTINSLSGADATTALNDALAKLMYTANAQGSDTLTITSKDTGLGSSAGPRVTTSTLGISNITAAAAAPVNVMPLSIDQTTTAVVAGKAFAFVGSNLPKVSDVNNDIIQVQLKVVSGTLSLAEAIAGITASNADAGKTLTLTIIGLSGADATAALNNALAKLTYTANGTAALNDTLTLTTTDSRNTTDTDTLALAVKAAPNKPVNTLPLAGPSGIIVGEAKTLSGIRVDDADNNLASVTVTVLKGRLNLTSDTTGITLSGADSKALTLTTSLKGEAAKTALNSALINLTYTADAGTTSDTLSVTTTDSTGTPLGGPQTDTDTLALTVSSRPVNTLPATFGGIIVGQAAALPDVRVDDIDNNLASVTVTVLNGKLNLTSATTGITLSGADSNALTLTTSLTGEASKTAFNTALEKLLYIANAGTTTDTLSIATTDSSALTTSNALSFTVYAAPVAPVNYLPTEHNTLFAGTKVLSGQDFHFKDSGNTIAVSDGDNNLASVVLTVDQGTLSVTASSEVAVSLAEDGKTLTLTGTNATALNATLATLVYNAGAHTGAVHLTITTTDSTVLGSGPLSDSDFVDFTVLAAPINTLAAPANAVGDTALNINGLSVADVDNNLSNVVLTVTDGELSTTATSGVVSTNSGKTLTFSGELADINTALSGLSYKLADQRGKTGVTLSIVSTDDSGLSDTDTVTFDVEQAEQVAHMGGVNLISSTGSYGVGATLTAQSSLTDDNGLGALTYEWFRTVGSESPSKITTATSSTYTLVGADAGATLSVKVSYTDGAGYPESASSDATGVVTWPNNLRLGTTGLSFIHDDPLISGAKNSATSSDTQTQFIELQQGKYYVLDVDGDGAITTADKTTYLTGLNSSTNSITTGSGHTLQLLSDTDWAALKTSLSNVLPTRWAASADAATADYWTSTQGSSASFHKVYAFGTGALTTYANDATASSPTPYHYNVFQVI